MIVPFIVLDDTDRYIQNTDTAQKHFQRHLQKIYFQYLNETPYDLVAAQ